MVKSVLLWPQKNQTAKRLDFADGPVSGYAIRVLTRENPGLFLFAIA